MRRYSHLLLFALAACGSATETIPPRYNFAVVDGANQISVAGATALDKRITSQLARDPRGKFASSSLDWLMPPKAFAQGLGVAGEPVSGAIVCAREAAPGEPQAVPLCAFTLADGKAPIEIKPGTKAGIFDITFTAQVQTAEPVRDSTRITVEAGPPAEVSLSAPNVVKIAPGSTLDLHPFVVFVRDQYGNDVDWNKMTPGIAIRDGSEVGQPIAESTSWTIAWTPERAARGTLYLYVWFGDMRWRSFMRIEFE